MADENEYIDINAFMEEMVTMVNNRLRKQEEAIKSLESEMARLRKCTDSRREKGVRIDKSVLKVLGQKE